MVDRVRSMGDRIRVDFHIRGDIPIARGVRASIVPLNLVGERNLVPHPVWRPGMAKELGGMRHEIVIPIERTHVPVETDTALEAFTKVAGALDPTKTRAALGKAARSVEGTGQDFNAALEQGAAHPPERQRHPRRHPVPKTQEIAPRHLYVDSAPRDVGRSRHGTSLSYVPRPYSRSSRRTSLSGIASIVVPLPVVVVAMNRAL
jgi:hypothetical protein